MWSVDGDGLFSQCDVQFARKVVDFRSPAVNALTPQGELLMFSQRRAPPRQTSLEYASDQTVTAPNPRFFEYDNGFTRNSADDGMDDSFLSSSYKRHHGRSGSNRSTKTLGSTPPDSDDFAIKCAKLDYTLGDDDCHFKPNANLFFFTLGEHLGVDNFKYLAAKMKYAPYPCPLTLDNFDRVLRALEKNAKYAGKAGDYRLMQSFNIVALYFSHCLELPELDSTKPSPEPFEAPLGDSTLVKPLDMSIRKDENQQDDLVGERGSEFKRRAFDDLGLEARVEECDTRSVHKKVEPDIAFECRSLASQQIGEVVQQMIHFLIDEEVSTQAASHLLLCVLPFLPITRHEHGESRETKRILDVLASQLDQIQIDEHDAKEAMMDYNRIICQGLEPMMCEWIFRDYHVELISNGLFAYAASLRKHCYPTFPSVYEDHLRDVSVRIHCTQCGTLLHGNKIICDHCKRAPIACPICLQHTSPYNDSLDKGLSMSMGDKLRTACAWCGHGVHIACLNMWQADPNPDYGHQCPTEGCLCVCGATGEEAEMPAKTVRVVTGSEAHWDAE